MGSVVIPRESRGIFSLYSFEVETIAIIFGLVIAGIAGIPIIVLYSFRDWAEIRPATFPVWRHRIGTAALVTILGSWGIIMVLTILRTVNERLTTFYTGKMTFGLMLIALAATLSSVALKGSARVLALVAGVLLVFLILLSSTWINGEIT